MISFNENILDSKEVYYQSYSADLDDKKCLNKEFSSLKFFYVCKKCIKKHLQNLIII